MENFATDISGHVVVVGRRFDFIQDFFTNPCKSSYIGVYEVHELGSLNLLPVSDVLSKYVAFGNENRFIMPLLNSE